METLGLAFASLISLTQANAGMLSSSSIGDAAAHGDSTPCIELVAPGTSVGALQVSLETGGDPRILFVTKGTGDLLTICPSAEDLAAARKENSREVSVWIVQPGISETIITWNPDIAGTPRVSIPPAGAMLPERRIRLDISNIGSKSPTLSAKISADSAFEDEYDVEASWGRACTSRWNTSMFLDFDSPEIVLKPCAANARLEVVVRDLQSNSIGRTLVKSTETAIEMKLCPAAVLEGVVIIKGNVAPMSGIAVTWFAEPSASARSSTTGPQPLPWEGRGVIDSRGPVDGRVSFRLQGWMRVPDCREENLDLPTALDVSFLAGGVSVSTKSAPLDPQRILYRIPTVTLTRK